MERNELKDILIASVLVKRHAAAVMADSDPKDLNALQVVKNMVGLAVRAEQVAKIRAGSFMSNNITKEVEQFFVEQSMAQKSLLEAVLTKKEDKNVAN